MEMIIVGNILLIRVIEWVIIKVWLNNDVQSQYNFCSFIWNICCTKPHNNCTFKKDALIIFWPKTIDVVFGWRNIEGAKNINGYDGLWKAYAL